MSGKNKSIVLVIAIAALGAGGWYYMSQGNSDASESAVVETASGGEAAIADVPETPASLEGFVVEEGNPVVAIVDGKEITRVDVYRFIQTMPENVKRRPAAFVYPIALEQVINTRLVQNKADSEDIASSEAVQREMAMAKQQIVRNVFLQEQVGKTVTESALKASYKDYIKDIPDVEERRARHILVKTESKAKAVIKKLKTGEKFEDLAKEISTGPTAAKGGDLGYFVKTEMVPEFANAAFALKKGEVVAEPVKTQFGWHVIKAIDVRQRAKPTFEEMAPLLQADLRQEALSDLLEKWRKNAKVEQFDINGKPLKKGANAIGLVDPKQK